MAKKRPSTSATMAKAGFRPALLWLNPEQREKIETASKADGRPMTQFLIHHGLKAAEKILEKTARKP